MLILPCITHTCVRIYTVNRASLDVCSINYYLGKMFRPFLVNFRDQSKSNTLAINADIYLIFSMVHVDRLFTVDNNY